MQTNAAANLLAAENTQAADETLRAILGLGISSDMLGKFVEQLAKLFREAELTFGVTPNGQTSGGSPGCQFQRPKLRADVNRTLDGLHRFLQASRSPLAFLALFEREPDALQLLVRLLSLSQPLVENLLADPESFDLLRLTGGHPVEKSVLQDELLAEVSQVLDPRVVKSMLRGFRRRESLRIAFGEVYLGQPIETVAEQLTYLAEVILQAAVAAAKSYVDSKWPSAPDADDSLPFSVIALGQLGAAEMDYSNELELLFVYQTPNAAASSATNSGGYFERVAQKVVKLLSDRTGQGVAYEVDTRWKPKSAWTGTAVGDRQVVDYFESLGRTVDRMAFTKARAVAGDLEFGARLLERLQAWIYRRYLMRADVTGLAAVRRKIERQLLPPENADRRDANQRATRGVERTVQFLQLLHGGDDTSLRTQGTSEAMRRLAVSGYLSPEEFNVLQSAYRSQRSGQHWAQIVQATEREALPAEPESQPREIIQRLLADAMEVEVASPEADLILDPDPTVEQIRQTLSRYGFANVEAAYRHLLSLSTETIPFLSTRRCRHFLALIAPQLLTAVARTPSPDVTLISLARVSESLGGKAVLWELFSLNPPSMELCVRLCAASPYLANILTSNPGMIDELMDSLMLKTLPSHTELAEGLAALCRGATDLGPILQSFKNSMHLRVGVREVLGKSSIADTHRTLSDIAEVCLEQTLAFEFHRLVSQLGLPVRADAPANLPPSLEGSSEVRPQQVAELVVLAVGKLGGREPNYHSDLDVIFLFDGAGQTQSLVPNRRFEATTNRHFFNQLCQRVIHSLTRVGISGKLYDVDVSLRPLGKSGELAISIDDLRNYFADGAGQVWERQALCKARPIWGSDAVQQAAMQCVREALVSAVWTPEKTERLRRQRQQLERAAGERNLKRGVGGTMDIEFVVQLLQMAHASSHPEVLLPGTFAAIDAMKRVGVIDSNLADELTRNYEFLRKVESSIRLMNMSARHELPSDAAELERLAFLMAGPASESTESSSVPITGSALEERCAQVRSEVRATLDAVFRKYGTLEPS